MVFEQKFGFSVVFFYSHAAISFWFLLFFLFFGSDFFLNCFPNPFIVRSRSSFLFSRWKFFELYVRTCPAMFFNSSSPSMNLPTWLLGIDFFINFSDFYCFAVKICVSDVIFAFWSFAWLTLLKKMPSELTYGTLNFINIYWLKINSVHLSSAKLICPNSWVLVLSFWLRISIFRAFL